MRMIRKAEPEPIKHWRLTYHTTHPDGRVFERTLSLTAPNSQAALSKALRLLRDSETSWKISQFCQVSTVSAPAED